MSVVHGLRGRLLLAVLAALAAALAILILAFNAILRARLDADARELLTARAAAQLAALATVDGRLVVEEAPDDAALDSQAWVFRGGRPLERPQHAPAAVDALARGLAGGPRRFADTPLPPTRLLAVPVQRGAHRAGTVVVGVSLAPYERTERTALVASLVLAAALLGAVAVATRLALRAALRPVDRMTAEAARWSEQDVDRRFALGPPTDELTRLAATFDGFLDRVAAGFRREQRFSSELSHELRTPLTKLAARAQLLAEAPGLAADLRAEAEGMVRAAGQLRRTLDGLLAAARAEGGVAGGAAELASTARAAIGDVSARADERSVALGLATSPGALCVAAEPQLVERLLAPLLDNAVRLARTEVRVELERDGRMALARVDDDGPGVAAGEEQAIFEPGRRGSAGAGDASSTGAGLGLALARRLARSVGGDVEARASPAGGRFVVRLPAA